jgi:hypothetical protein
MPYKMQGISWSAAELLASHEWQVVNNMAMGYKFLYFSVWDQMLVTNWLPALYVLNLIWRRIQNIAAA